MDTLEAVASRASATRLGDPGPTADDLETIIAAATRAPDHGRLTPWRFVVFEGAGRERLGELLVRSLARRDPDADAKALEREAAKVLRAPVVIAVVAAIQAGKIPEIEQVLAVGAGVQNMILAAHALGYGTMWKTGAPAYDPELKTDLGFSEADHIVAFVYLGTTLASLGPRKVDVDVLTRKG